VTTEDDTTTPEEPTDVPVEEAPQADLNAVIVVKTIDEQGNLRTQVQTSGSVQITEVQFLLEAAIKDFRKAVGLDG
jgi:hypothetical protein